MAWRSDSPGRGVYGDVGRLQVVLSLEEGFKSAVDDVKYSCIAAKIGRQPAFDAILRLDDFLDDFEIGLDVGPAKSIDRLFGIADDEDFAGSQFHLAPVLGRSALGFGEIEQDLVLDRIGILKFVDEDRAVAPFEVGAHVILVADEIACAHEQAIEGKMAFADKSFAEVFGVGNQQAPEQAGQFPIDLDQPFGGTHERLSVCDVVGLPTFELSTDRLLG